MPLFTSSVALTLERQRRGPYQPGPTAQATVVTDSEGLKARSKSCGLDGSGLQPLVIIGTVSWAVGPGWYENGPLALRRTHRRLLGNGGDVSTPANTTRPAAWSAFTRTDLLISLGVVALLALVILPALANQRPRSARVICANNLRQIGVGFQLWGQDHADMLPQETHVSEGGTSLHPLVANVWLHLSWISNEVVSPSVFLCPSDSGRPARDFTAHPASGYLHGNFRNRATSYFLGYVSFERGNTPEAVIAGDRNLNWDQQVSCSRLGIAQSIFQSTNYLGGRWTNALHGTAGNVLSFDGRVRQLGNPGLKHALTPLPGDSDRKHLIFPR